MSFDIAIAARTVWGEARGEGKDGMEAVAWAIINRYKAEKWFSGKTIAACCLMAYQFSCWNANDPNRVLMASMPENDAFLLLAVSFIQEAMKGTGPDPVAGATHYYAATGPAPAWAMQGTFVLQIGKHRFYKNVK